VASAQFPLPPVSEQRAIADFLDRETAKIDALRLIRVRLLGLVRERLAAGAWQAVRGAGRGDSLLETAVDWIGAIPPHWDVRPIGQLARVVRGASPRPAGDLRFFEGDFLPWITVGEITGEHSKYLDRASSCLTREGASHSRLVEPGTLIQPRIRVIRGTPRSSS